jgi:hypothetical protein
VFLIIKNGLQNHSFDFLNLDVLAKIFFADKDERDFFMVAF